MVAPVANPPAPDVEAIARGWALNEVGVKMLTEQIEEAIAYALTAHTASLQARVEELERQVQSAEGVISTFQRANNLYREAMDERTTFKNQARAAEAEANRMREALEPFAKLADDDPDPTRTKRMAFLPITQLRAARAALRPADEPVTQREM